MVEVLGGDWSGIGWLVASGLALSVDPDGAVELLGIGSAAVLSSGAGVAPLGCASDEVADDVDCAVTIAGSPISETAATLAQSTLRMDFLPMA